MKKTTLSTLVFVLMTFVTYANQLEGNPLINNFDFSETLKTTDTQIVSIEKEVNTKTVKYFKWEIYGEFTSSVGTSESIEMFNEALKLIKMNDIVISVVLYSYNKEVRS